MVSVLYPGYRKPAMNGDAMSESFKLSHRWERKMEMERLGPSGLGARLDGLAANRGALDIYSSCTLSRAVGGLNPT
jgi:hypothetical protein